MQVVARHKCDVNPLVVLIDFIAPNGQLVPMLVHIDAVEAPVLVELAQRRSCVVLGRREFLQVFFRAFVVVERLDLLYVVLEAVKSHHKLHVFRIVQRLIPQRLSSECNVQTGLLQVQLVRATQRKRLRARRDPRILPVYQFLQLEDTVGQDGGHDKDAADAAYRSRFGLLASHS